jgi:hypothetical protein
MIQHEILTELAKSTDSYLEIGVQEGHSLKAVLGSNPTIDRLLLCDSWGRDSGGSGRGSHFHIIDLLDQLKWAGSRLDFLDGDSRETLPPMYKLFTPFELVHVDGGHSYEVASSDLDYGWRLCSKRMVVHDVVFTEVYRALCEFLNAQTNVSINLFHGGHGTAIIERKS